MGLADAEDHMCSLGPEDAFNALNTITGISFMSGVVILVLFIIYFCFKQHERFKKVMTAVIIGFIAGSLIIIATDMVYSFYVASRLLPEVQRWEEDKTLCDEAVFRSAFGVIVIYFLLVFAVVVTGAVILAYFLFKSTRRYRHLPDCFRPTDDS